MVLKIEIDNWFDLFRIAAFVALLFARFLLRVDAQCRSIDWKLCRIIRISWLFDKLRPRTESMLLYYIKTLYLSPFKSQFVYQYNRCCNCNIQRSSSIAILYALWLKWFSEIQFTFYFFFFFFFLLYLRNINELITKALLFLCHAVAFVAQHERSANGRDSKRCRFSIDGNRFWRYLDSTNNNSLYIDLKLKNKTAKQQKR